MVRPIKSDCCIPWKRTRTGRTSFKRAGYPLTGERDSKLSSIKRILRQENRYQPDALIECQILKSK